MNDPLTCLEPRVQLKLGRTDVDNWTVRYPTCHWKSEPFDEKVRAAELRSRVQVHAPCRVSHFRSITVCSKTLLAYIKHVKNAYNVPVAPTGTLAR